MNELIIQSYIDEISNFFDVKISDHTAIFLVAVLQKKEIEFDGTPENFLEKLCFNFSEKEEPIFLENIGEDEKERMRKMLEQTDSAIANFKRNKYPLFSKN